MDARIRDFIAEVARDVVGLEVALFFQANPATFDTPAGLALRLQARLEEVQPALERLEQAGALEAFTRGDGCYRCYALSGDRQVWHLLCLVSEAYLDHPEDRKEIVRLLVDRGRVASGRWQVERGGRRSKTPSPEGEGAGGEAPVDEP